MLKYIDRYLRQRYKRVTVKEVTYQSPHKFKLEDKKKFVNLILSKKDTRQILEKYIQWKADIYTGMAMRAKTDEDTREAKAKVDMLNRQNADFQVFWSEVKEDLKEREHIKLEKKEGKKIFKLFGTAPKDESEE